VSGKTSAKGRVERSDTHHASAQELMGIAALHPFYAVVEQRCLVQIVRVSKNQLLSSCHALLGSEHRSRAPLSQEIES
jgi:hypothetical protein